MNLTARFDNPVLTKELRTLMRDRRAYWMLFSYVMLLSLVLCGTYFMWHQVWAHGYQAISANPVGRYLFTALFTAQAILICLMTPTLAAGKITLEREQRTFELLLLTMLKPREVVVGKLLSAFAFAVLLITASLPLAGICFMMGGVSEGEIAAVYLLLLASSLFFSSLGILASAALRSTTAATATTYLTGLFLFGVTGVAAGGGQEVVFSAVNPVGAVRNALATPPLFRWQVVAWIPALVVLILAALLATAGAIHRLEEGVSDRPGTLRWLTYLLFCVLAVGIIGNIAGSAGRTTGGGGIQGTAAILGGCLLVPLAVLALLFCSGDSAEALGLPAAAGRQGPAAGSRLGRLLRSRLFTGGYAWGPAYVLLLFVTGAVLLSSSFWLAGHQTWILELDAILAVLTVVFATVACYGAAARFFSTLMPSRFQAISVTLGVLLLLALAPLVYYVYWDPGSAPAHALLAETLQANPVMALLAIGTSAGWWSRSVPPLWAGQEGAWVVTVLFYLALATLFELGRLRRLAACRRQSTSPRLPSEAAGQ
ncbi:MAG: ABC transporter permease subunit [Armatimonadetes bacterium]|nr:ABC transporter permease subunit [Armatimonadota bacterium]